MEGDALAPGSRFAGDYTIERVAGRGAMGVVYCARHEELDRLVAVKVAAPAIADLPEFRERLLREARLAAKIEHPAVVTVHHAGVVDGRPYVVLQWVEGADLRSRLAAGPLDPAYALSIVEQLGDALDAAHATGCLHRDVKPANVLVRDTPAGPRAYLTDFGVAKALQDSGGAGLTATTAIVGTPGYLSPELARGGEGDERSDLYGLACVAFELLSGTPPFTGPTVAALLVAHAVQPRPLLSQRRSGLPPAVDAMLVAAMSIEPDDRPASGAQLGAQLRAALGMAIAGGETIVPHAAMPAPVPAAMPAAPPAPSPPVDPGPDPASTVSIARPLHAPAVVAPGGHLTRPAGVADNGRSCPYCRFAFKLGVDLAICPSCSAPHHAECWEDNGGCSLMGCKSGPAGAAAPAAPPRSQPAAMPPPAAAEGAPPPGFHATLPQPPPPPAAPAPGATRARRGLGPIAIVAIVLVGLVVIGGAIGGTLLLTGDGDKPSDDGAQVSPPAAPPPPPGPPPPPAPSTASSRRDIVAVLRRYETAYSNRDTDALRAILTPGVQRRGLQPGGCGTTSGREAVLDVYQSQFDTGTGSYDLVGLTADAISTDGTKALTKLRYTIGGGNSGQVSFVFERIDGEWRISNVLASC